MTLYQGVRFVASADRRWAGLALSAVLMLGCGSRSASTAPGQTQSTVPTTTVQPSGAAVPLAASTPDLVVLSTRAAATAPGYVTVTVLLALRNGTDSLVGLEVLPATAILGVTEGRTYPGKLEFRTVGNTGYEPQHYLPRWVLPRTTHCGLQLNYDDGNGVIRTFSAPLTATFTDVPQAAHPASVAVAGFPSTAVPATEQACPVPRAIGAAFVPHAFAIKGPGSSSGSTISAENIGTVAQDTPLSPPAMTVTLRIKNGAPLDPLSARDFFVWVVTRAGQIVAPGGCPSGAADPGGGFYGTLLEVGPGVEMAETACFGLSQAGISDLAYVGIASMALGLAGAVAQ